jgi:hypothetical protein
VTDPGDTAGDPALSRFRSERGADLRPPGTAVPRQPQARPTVVSSFAGRATTSKHHLVDGEVDGMVPAGGDAAVTPQAPA